MKKRAQDRARCLEILFHPGRLLADEMGEEFVNRDANKFYLSENRQIEYRSVMSLHTEELG